MEVEKGTTATAPPGGHGDLESMAEGSSFRKIHYLILTASESLLFPTRFSDEFNQKQKQQKATGAAPSTPPPKNVATTVVVAAAATDLHLPPPLVLPSQVTIAALPSLISR